MKTQAANVEYLSKNLGAGPVAQALLENNFDVQALRTNTVLRKDEFIQYDERVVEVATQRLVGVADLMNAGLTFNLNNPLGTTQVEWEKVSEMTAASISMGGLTSSQNDRVTFDLDSLPVPIIHKDFQINIRALEASRNRGDALDTTQAEIAARIVSETAESLLFTGSNIAGTNNKIFGYTTYTDRNTGSVTASWLTATGEQIVNDVIAMIGAAQADNMYGPYMLYVPNAVLVAMGDDYKSNSDKTIIQRVMEIPGIMGIRPTKDLTGTNIILVQMTRDVVDLINGLEPTVVQWESHGGFLINFKVLAIMVPRIRSDKTGQCGIVHYS